MKFEEALEKYRRGASIKRGYWRKFYSASDALLIGDIVAEDWEAHHKVPAWQYVVSNSDGLDIRITDHATELEASKWVEGDEFVVIGRIMESETVEWEKISE